MSKTAAKKTTPAKKAAPKKSAAPAKKAKPAAKAPARAAKAPAKSPPKAPAKKSARGSVRPATKPAAKTAAKIPPKPAARPAPRGAASGTAKPAPKAITPSPMPPQAKSPVPPSPAPAPKPAAAPAPSPRASKPGKAPVVMPTSPPPVQGSSRFADRFAPPKPPARQVDTDSSVARPAYKADPKLANAWKAKAGRELSEGELMSMPEAEYMNDKQLDFFRARLQTLKDDLLSNAGETTEHLREDTSIVPDPADRATIEEEHALELRTRDRERKLLKKISQSLVRIDSGDYGFCDETGEPIGLGRLIARPTATLSLEAQQRRELKQKMFGD